MLRIAIIVFLLSIFFLSVPYPLDKENNDTNNPAEQNIPVKIKDAKLPPPSELPPDGL